MEGQEGDFLLGGDGFRPPTTNNAFGPKSLAGAMFSVMPSTVTIPLSFRGPTGNVMNFGTKEVSWDHPALVEAVNNTALIASGIFDAAINLWAGNYSLAFATALQTANQVSPNDQALAAALISTLISHAQSLAQSPDFKPAAGPLAFQVANWGGVFGQAPGGGKFAFDGGYVSFASGGATVSAGRGETTGEGGTVSIGDAPQSP
jgi:hypothetical protein